MAFTFLRLNAKTKLDSHLISVRAKEAMQAHGTILDTHLVRDQSLTLRFKLAVGKIAQLHASLREAGLKLSEESKRLLANCRRGLEQLDAESSASEVTGTLQIIFIHEEPDSRIEVPPIPG